MRKGARGKAGWLQVWWNQIPWLFQVFQANCPDFPGWKPTFNHGVSVWKNHHQLHCIPQLREIFITRQNSCIEVVKSFCWLPISGEAVLQIIVTRLRNAANWRLQRSAAAAERRFLSYKNWVSCFILDPAIVCECRIVFGDKHEMERTILYLIGLL